MAIQAPVLPINQIIPPPVANGAIEAPQEGRAPVVNQVAQVAIQGQNQPPQAPQQPLQEDNHPPAANNIPQMQNPAPAPQQPAVAENESWYSWILSKFEGIRNPATKKIAEVIGSCVAAILPVEKQDVVNRVDDLVRSFFNAAIVWAPLNILPTFVAVGTVITYGVIHMIAKSGNELYPISKICGKTAEEGEHIYKYIHHSLGWAALVGAITNIVSFIFTRNPEYRTVAFVCAAASVIFFTVLKNKPDPQPPANNNRPAVPQELAARLQQAQAARQPAPAAVEQQHAPAQQNNPQLQQPNP